MNEILKFLTENNFNQVKIDEPLKNHTSFKVGGETKFLVVPETKEQLVELVFYLKSLSYPYKILGKGSNILPSDKTYEGVVIKTELALNNMIIEDDIITVGAGYSLVKLAYQMIEEELTGLEFLGGIPGSIGGAIYMNAGAYLKEMKDIVLDVLLIDQNGTLKNVEVEELQYTYRHSIFQSLPSTLIIETRLKAERGNKEEIASSLQTRRMRRMETQPLDYPSAGSTFRNPKGMHAYQLIDQANLRGYKIGGAKVSEKHCNFVVNYNQASSQDIKDLIDYIIEKVYKITKVMLIPEVEFFNW